MTNVYFGCWLNFGIMSARKVEAVLWFLCIEISNSIHRDLMWFFTVAVLINHRFGFFLRDCYIDRFYNKCRTWEMRRAFYQTIFFCIFWFFARRTSWAGWNASFQYIFFHIRHRGNTTSKNIFTHIGLRSTRWNA